MKTIQVVATKDRYRTKAYRAGDRLSVDIVSATPAQFRATTQNPRFHVAVYDIAGNRVDRLLHGPWSLPTARKKARELAARL